MKKYIITFLMFGLVAGIMTVRFSPPMVLAAFSDPFISVQLAPSPSSGNCLTTNGTSNSWSSSCGSGSTSLSPWATTTSQVSGQYIVYPNNNTDIVTAGGTATSSAFFSVDPNIGAVQIGTGVAPQLCAFGGCYYQLQVIQNANDGTGMNLWNTSSGSNAFAGIFLNGDRTPQAGAGALATYYTGWVHANSNWNGVPLGFGGLPANGSAIYNSDGSMIIASATTTGRIDLYTGAGTFAGGTPDATLLNNGNFGIATGTPGIRLGVMGDGIFSGRVGATSFTATSSIATSTFAGAFSIGSTTPSNNRKFTFIGGSGYQAGGDAVNNYTPELVGTASSTTFGFSLGSKPFSTDANYLYTMSNLEGDTCPTGLSGDGCEAKIWSIATDTPQFIAGFDIGANNGSSIFNSGDYLYTSQAQSAGTCSSTVSTGCEIKIFLMSADRSTLTYKGGIETGSNVRGIYVIGKMLYFGTDSGFFQIADISDPANPIIKGKFSTGSEAIGGIFVKENYAHIVSVQNLVSMTYRILDITNASNIVQVGSMNLGAAASSYGSIYVRDNFAFVGKATTGIAETFIIYNFASTTPTGQIAIATTTALNLGAGVDTITVDGRFAYLGMANVGNQLREYDVYDPYNVALVAGTSGLNEIRGLVVANNRVYAGYAAGGASASTNLRVYKAPGIEFQSIIANNFTSGNGFVKNNFSVGNNLYSESLNVGVNGIYSQGPIVSYVASTTENQALAAAFLGFVGVGTSSPRSKFMVAGASSNTSLTVYQTDPNISILNTDTTANNLTNLDFMQNNSIASSTTDVMISAVHTSHTSGSESGDVAFSTRSSGTLSEKMRLTAAGNLGIGTTTANWPLQVAGTRPLITLSDTSATTDQKHWFMSSQGGNFYVGTSTDSLNGTTTLLSIAQNGTMIIGSSTVANAAQLTVKNSSASTNIALFLDSGNTARFTFANSGSLTTAGSIGSNSNGIFAGVSGSAVGFTSTGTATQTGDLSRWVRTSFGILGVVNNWGNLGLGTTTPYAQLSISATSTATTTFAIKPISAQTASIFDLYNTSGTLTDVISSANKWGLGTTSPSGKLAVNGTVFMAGLSTAAGTISGGSYLCQNAGFEVIADTSTCLVSSARFKNNIEPLTSALAEVLKTRPVSFFYNKTGNASLDARGEELGFIAEDMQKVEPRLVELDKNGKPLKVKYENMTALLARAIQEIWSHITGIDSRLAEQQKEIDSLKKQVELLTNKK